MIFKIRVYYSLFGRNPNGAFSNEFMFKSSLSKSDPKMRTLGLNLMSALATIQVNEAQCLRAVIAEVRRHGSAPVPRGEHYTIPGNVSGSRATTSDPTVGLKEAVAIFAKTTGPGFAGSQRVRGCFYDGELGAGGDGTITLNPDVSRAPFTAFALALPGIFTAQSCTYCLPAIKTADFDAGARPVIAVSYQGVGLLQLSNSRRSISQEQIDVAKREISALERAYQKAARDANGTIQAVGGAILNGLLSVLQGIINKYTLSVILRLALPAGVRLLVNALPA
jgi:glutaredoxin